MTGSRRAALPAYFDSLIAAYHSGHAGRHVHLGYWDDPPPLSAPVLPNEFAMAQSRLTQRMIAHVGARTGQCILDVGCGLGGTLAALNERHVDTSLVGLNIDRRQLEICRSIAPRACNRLSLVEADACALPFGRGVFDVVVAVEAMFHFPTRRGFLAEAARVLRRGGVLLITDILLHRPTGSPPWPTEAMQAVIRRDYGPWPAVWLEAADLASMAQECGLLVTIDEDWSQATLPTYRIVSPDAFPERRARPDAGAVFRWLHTHGFLTYRMLALRSDG